MRGESSDQFEVRRIRTAELATAIYRLTAQAATKRGDVARAAAYEARAGG